MTGLSQPTFEAEPPTQNAWRRDSGREAEQHLLRPQREVAGDDADREQRGLERDLP
jgi:hypothetical protein